MMDSENITAEPTNEISAGCNQNVTYAIEELPGSPAISQHAVEEICDCCSIPVYPPIPSIEDIYDCSSGIIVDPSNQPIPSNPAIEDIRDCSGIIVDPHLPCDCSGIIVDPSLPCDCSGIIVDPPLPCDCSGIIVDPPLPCDCSCGIVHPPLPCDCSGGIVGPCKPIVEDCECINNATPIQCKDMYIVNERGNMEIVENIPEIVFIIPYRDRSAEKAKFLEQMDTILDDDMKAKCKIFFVEQKDTRPFNRGAIKNIGFLIIKNLFPCHYKNITIVFNDVDTTPAEKGLIDYKTKQGTIKHFFGFNFALGGIVSITGADFEKLNGFPNYWAWGFEDNLLNIRAVKANIQIDRSQFYPMNDKRILQIKGSSIKDVNRGEFDRYIKNVPEGINTIYAIHYKLQPEDYINGHIYVTHFETQYKDDPKKRTLYDLKNGAAPFTVGPAARRGARMGMIL